MKNNLRLFLYAIAIIIFMASTASLIFDVEELIYSIGV
jgi:hypothetical protein